MTCDDAKGSEEKHLSHLFNKMKLPKWIFFIYFFFPLHSHCASLGLLAVIVYPTAPSRVSEV